MARDTEEGPSTEEERLDARLHELLSLMRDTHLATKDTTPS
jgi:hypothetical protein